LRNIDSPCAGTGTTASSPPVSATLSGNGTRETVTSRSSPGTAASAAPIVSSGEGQLSALSEQTDGRGRLP
jgi:hypothetical protein